MFRYQFDEHANDVINYAFSEARDLGHQYVGTEHLVLGLSMLEHVGLKKTFEAHKITPERVRTEIIKCIGKGDGSSGIEDYTPRAKMCLERSRNYALSMDSQDILAEHLFISIMQDKYANGYKILSQISFDVMDMVDWLFENTMTPPQKNIIKQAQSGHFEIHLLDFDTDYDGPTLEGPLEKMTMDITEVVKDHVFGPVFGRDAEIKRVVQILTRKTKNSPCIVGAPGIGKTAIVYGLAKAILEGEVPDVLKDKRILLVNASGMVAGTMYRGQFEERLQQLIDFVKENTQYILFFDEMHTLVGLGATGERSLDAMGILKPFLTSGAIQIIGTATDADFERFISTDQALSRRLVKVQIEEPSLEQTLEILKETKHHYETYHDVIITETALQTAVTLSQRYLIQRKQPDKAIDIIDEACSRKRLESLQTVKVIDELKYRLQQLKHQKEQAILKMDFNQASEAQREEKRLLDHVEKNETTKRWMSQRKLTVDVVDIENVISEWANIPLQRLSTRERERMRYLDRALSEHLVGQPNAVDIVARALKRSRTGIKDHQRPVGNFLFIGPTGVGKTELSKAIADIFYGDASHLVRFDMSEYMERHSVSKLIGSPPGYEGNKEGGLLTNALQRQPYTVLLFDEIEKAHSDVLNLLLQVMDEGKLTDGRGTHVDARQALIILTSNLGVETLNQRTMGFSGGSAREVGILEEKLRDAAKRFFKPEFVNRLDEIVIFNPLNQEALTQIAHRQLASFATQLSETGCILIYGDEIPAFIATQSYSEAYGARPMKRYIDRYIKDIVADELLMSDETPKQLELHINDDVITIERKT